MDNLPEVLTRISNRLDVLEARISRLEHPADAPAALPGPGPLELATGTALRPASLDQSGATFAVLGKAMLGMAGAYILRAIAESGSFPKFAVVALAIAYACAWLVWAARVPAERWFATTTYSGTSALIFAPMLWELTFRFQVLSPTASAALLAGFLCTGYVLAWKRTLTSIVWVASLATGIAAIALLLASHDLEPFLAVLLMMSLLSETAACRGHWLGVRPVVAFAADLAVWMLLYIYANPDRNPSDYATLSPRALIAPSIVLFLIYAIGVAVRTLRLQQRISIFETGQAVICFAFASYTVLHFAPAFGAWVLGAFCLALSIALYAAVFGSRILGEPRNILVYSVWSLALFLLGSFLCLPGPWLASTLGIAAIVATYSGASGSRLRLAFHGLVYLCAAAAASGLLVYAAHAFAGLFPAPPEFMVWIVAAAVLLCYAIAAQTAEQRWQTQLFRTLSATLAVGSVAAILVSVIVWLTRTVITPGVPHVAVIRTLSACILALALAWAGPRWHRGELVWLAYAALAAVALKLLVEDLRHGHAEFIAASIFLYAVTLILVPQIVRKSNYSSRPVQTS